MWSDEEALPDGAPDHRPLRHAAEGRELVNFSWPGEPLSLQLSRFAFQ